ncbi:MAG: hypothetical protein ACOC3V_05150 [bacterium]
MTLKEINNIRQCLSKGTYIEFYYFKNNFVSGYYNRFHHNELGDLMLIVYSDKDSCLIDCDNSKYTSVNIIEINRIIIPRYEKIKKLKSIINEI